jgi:hypothetical protein
MAKWAWAKWDRAQWDTAKWTRSARVAWQIVPLGQLAADKAPIVAGIVPVAATAPRSAAINAAIAQTAAPASNASAAAPPAAAPTTFSASLHAADEWVEYKSEVGGRARRWDARLHALSVGRRVQRVPRTIAHRMRSR